VSVLSEAIKMINEDLRARLGIEARIMISAHRNKDGSEISQEVAQYIAEKISRETGGRLSVNAGSEYAWFKVTDKISDVSILFIPVEKAKEMEAV
jgi:hypothetical protein